MLVKVSQRMCFECEFIFQLTGSHQVFPVIVLSAKDSFSPKVFFKTVGLSKKSPTEIERVFKILDQDKSGYIEQDELQLSMHNKLLINECISCCP